MLTTVLVIVGIAVGAVIGFGVGRKYQPVDPAQYRRVPRRTETSRPVDQPVEAPRTLADDLFGRLPAAEATRTGTATFSAAHKGDVFVVLARPDSLLALADVEIEVVWGAHRGVTTIPLGATPVAVKFGKNKASARDAVVTVNTSEATVRTSCEGAVFDGVEVHTLAWK
jgi:hypothetical protein